MRALYATAAHPTDPLSGIAIGDRPDPTPPPGWVRVKMSAGSLNRHDLWTLRGVGIKPENFPMTLGCDGAGTLDDGTDVVIYPVIGDPDFSGDETVDPKRSIFTEVHQGLLSEYAVVPARCAVPRPASLTAAQAATLGCTYLTAYRMIFTRSGLKPGATMLVQGASGGVSTALIQLGVAAGLRVWVTSRSQAGRDRAKALGAHAVFESNARLPERVDGVFESVGQTTWAHTMRAVKPGGVVVCCGATTGFDPSADLQRLFFLQISVIGSAMGTLEEFRSLISFCEMAGITPVVDETYSLDQGREALKRLENDAPGKIVITI